VAVAAHFDLAREHVRLHPFGISASGTREWFAFPDLNSVAVRTSIATRSLDLATGEQFPPVGPESTAGTRAVEAHARARAPVRPPPTIVLADVRADVHALAGPWVKCAGGVVWLGNVRPTWPPFIPTADGKRLLDGVTKFGTAQFAGGTLALEAHRQETPARLYLFGGPNGRLLADYELGHAVFLLSPDGRRLARQSRERSVLVNDPARADEPVAYFGAASRHSNLSVQLETAWIKVGIGKTVHTFTLDTAVMHHGCVQSPQNLTVATAHPPTAVPAAFAYDPQRFLVAAACGPWTAVVDAWGQVLLLGPAGRIAAHIIVRRGLAAVVLPDGTRWGSPALLGGPETPGAAEAIGKALRAAVGGGP
jgi:hypothetical protein